jgi:TatD DNase family protein
MLIDTHAHLNFKAYKDDADEVIQRALGKGMLVINVGSQYSTSQRALDLAKKYKELFAVIGLHPIHLEKGIYNHKDDEELEEEEIKTNGELFDYQKYLELTKDSKVVAIGEVGLDYYHIPKGTNSEEVKAKQKQVFVEFIKLANEVKKPLVIHCREAYDDLLEIIQNNPIEKKGIIHSFVGSYKTAQKFIDLGFKIGLNGIITYGPSYDRLIKEIELKDIVIETDCPYLTPVPYKGERNEPILVELVAQKIVVIKGLNLDEIAEITTQNAKKVFNIN